MQNTSFSSNNAVLRVFWAAVAVGFPLSSLAAGEPVGKLGAVIGKAQVMRDGKSIAAVKGAPIYATDALVTAERTAVKIEFLDGSSFMAFEGSSVKIEEYQIKAVGAKGVSVKSALDVAKGKVRFFVKPKQDGGSNEVTFKTANAVMGIRGTSGFIDTTTPGKTQLVVLTGKVEVSNPKLPGQMVFVGANQMTDVVGARPPLPAKPAPVELVKKLSSDSSRVDPATEKKEEKKATEKKDEKQEGKQEEEKKSNDESKQDKASADENKDDKKEAVKEDKPAAEEKKDAAKEDKPAAEEKKDAAKEDKPAAEEKKEAKKEDKPAAEEKKEAKKEDRPAAEEKKEVKKEDKPAAEEKKEVKKENKPAPVAEKKAEPAPVVEKKAEPAPAAVSASENKPAPTGSVAPAAEPAPKPVMQSRVVYTPEGSSSMVVTGNTQLQNVIAAPNVGQMAKVQETQTAQAMQNVQQQVQAAAKTTEAVINQQVTTVIQQQIKAAENTGPRRITVKVQAPPAPPAP